MKKRISLVSGSVLLACCIAGHYMSKSTGIAEVAKEKSSVKQPQKLQQNSHEAQKNPFADTFADVVCSDIPFSVGIGEKVDIALDRVYIKGNGKGKCFEKFDAVANVNELETHRNAVAQGLGKNVSLVGFLHGVPRCQDTMRTISNSVLIKTESLEECIQDAKELGLEFSHRSSHPSYYVFRATDGSPISALNAASAIERSKNVMLAQMNVGQQLRKFATVNDPLYKEQWHLKNTGQGNGIPGEDANLEPAWDLVQGSGIVIGVNDDAVQLNHPDLQPNVTNYHLDMGNSVLVFNPDGTLNEAASTIDSDPSPGDDELDDNHGTAVAGVAAARGNNNIGVTGAAPFALISAVRIFNAINDGVTDTEEIALLNTFRAVDIHVKNNSWGSSNQAWFSNAAGLEADSLMRAGTIGRGGRGTIHAYAAGNSREFYNQASKSGRLNSPYVIPVAAIGNRGGHSNYSDFGPMIVVGGPSGTSAANGIVTTDRTGVRGYNTLEIAGELKDNNYTNTFSGTSSATPLVSGIIALMLEANPNLGYRDVKEILLRTSGRTDLDGRGWVIRDGLRPDLPPIKHHNAYGGGTINAHAAVVLARDWTNLPALAPEITKSITLTSPAVLLRQDEDDLTGSFTVRNFDTTADPLVRVEHVFVDFPNGGLDIDNVPDLSLILTAPDGTESVFHYADKELALLGSDETVPADFYFTSVRHWGSQSRGVWRLRVADGQINRDQFQEAPYGVTLSSARIRISGTPLSEDQTRIISITGPVDLDFGTQDVGNDNTRSFTITNSGGVDMHVTKVRFSGDEVFSGNFSGVVPANSSRNFDVTFSPTSAKTFNGVMLVDSTATQGTASVAIKGTGRQVPAPTITALANQTIRASSSVSIPITSEYAVSFKQTGLPRGLSIDPVTGTISGNTSATGTFKVVVTAINPWGQTKINFDLVIQPFAASLQGSYTMTIDRSPEINSGFGGMLRMNVMANGTYSGQILIGNNRVPIRGFIAGATSGNPVLNQVVGGRGTPEYSLQLEFFPNQTVSGKLDFVGSISTAEAIIEGWRNSYLAAKSFPNVGFYNHQLSLSASSVGVVSIPQGHGFYSQNIANTGLARVMGITSDGQRFTSLGDIGSSGEYVVWSMIYRGRGVVADIGDINDKVATGNGFWIKTPHELDTARLYYQGFGIASEVDLVTTGGYYTPPSSTQTYLGKVPGTNNAQIKFTNGGLSQSAMNPNMTFSLGTAGLVTLPVEGSTQNPAKIRLRINNRNGSVTGEMIIVDPNPIIPIEPYQRRVAFNGVIDSSANKAYGFFLLNQLPPTTGLPIPLTSTSLLSGGFIIE